MARPAENVVAFYNKRDTANNGSKRARARSKWTRLSCRSFAANAVRLQLHTPARGGGLRLANNDNSRQIWTGDARYGECRSIWKLLASMPRGSESKRATLNSRRPIALRERLKYWATTSFT